MIKKNKLKQALKEGKVIKGVLQFIPHPDITEMLAATGWDFIQFEAEHAISADEGKVLTLAADASGITPLVKLAGLDPLQIAHWLDAGVQGVKVQHIQTRADAEPSRQSVQARTHRYSVVVQGYAGSGPLCGF
jgi:4-hydroxy-2-oxoheptanedioate aldolase